MTDEEQKDPKPTGENKPKTAKPEQLKQITVQEVLNNYPLDRETVNSQLLLLLHSELVKISKTLEWIAKRKQEEIDRNIKLKE